MNEEDIIKELKSLSPSEAAIEGVLYLLEGKDALIDTMTHNEEVLMEELDKKTSLINTMQAEFDRLEDLEDDTDMLKFELKKKDKIIEYMANFINNNTPYTKDTRILENERGVRNTKYTEQFFERKVENGE